MVGPPGGVPGGVAPPPPVPGGAAQRVFAARGGAIARFIDAFFCFSTFGLAVATPFSAAVLMRTAEARLASPAAHRVAGSRVRKVVLSWAMVTGLASMCMAPCASAPDA